MPNPGPTRTASDDVGPSAPIRVLHIPGHLSYAEKLTAADFTPVPPPPGGVLTADSLLCLTSWEFFDVLHLHTAELTSWDTLRSLLERLAVERRGLVFTIHDLSPNIEHDVRVFEQKTQLLADHSTSLVTLTGAAADTVEEGHGRRPVVIPHGYTVPPPAERPRGAVGLVVLGALRPNRKLLPFVRAWRRLPSNRPPLHLVLRSVSDWDRQHYRADMDDLTTAATAEPALHLTVVDRMLTVDELVAHCGRGDVLALPYDSVTHSGQLELARDLGLALLAPDVPTLRAQISETGPAHPGVWFPPAALGEPLALAGYLDAASSLRHPTAPLLARDEEHRQLLRRYRAAYEQACTRR